MRRCFAAFLAIALFDTGFPVRAGGRTLFEVPVHNAFQATCRLWWYGTNGAEPLDWEKHEINRQQTRLIRFGGDDPFVLVVRLDRIERSLGYVRLREFAELNPGKPLILSGQYLTRMYYVFNSRSRRYELQRIRVGYVVHADLTLRDGTVLRLSARGSDMPGY